MTLADSSFPALSGHYSAGRNLVSWGLGPLNFSAPIFVPYPTATGTVPGIGLVSSTPGFFAVTSLPSLLGLESREEEPSTESTEPEYTLCAEQPIVEACDQPVRPAAEGETASFSTCDPNPDDDETPGAESKTTDYTTEE